MSNYEDHPIRSEMRDKLLSDIGELATKGGKLELDGIEIEVELADE